MALSKDYSSKKSLCKVSFELSAEKVAGASSIALLGTFNGWNATTHPLTKQANGNFKTAIDLAVGHTYEFRYLLDGHHWLNDDQGDAYVSSRVSYDDNFVVVVAAPAEKQASAKITAKVAEKVAPAKKEVAAKADDLTIVEGIGPKAAKVLITAGILTFDALAKAKAVAVKAILTAAEAKVGHLDPTTWAKQAKLAAAGKFAELEALKKALNNGKEAK